MMTCSDCVHWSLTHKGWGRCDIAMNGGLFNNKAKRDGKWYHYTARHTNTRYHKQRACKVRFVGRDEDKSDTYGGAGAKVTV